MWPSAAVERVSGDGSPAWEVYRTARRILEGGLRLGLVVEELIHVVDPQKLLTLREGGLEGGLGPAPPLGDRAHGLLLSDE